MLIKTSFQGSPLCCFIHTPCIVSNSNATFAFPTPQLLSPKIWETRHQPGPGSFPPEERSGKSLDTRLCIILSVYTLRIRLLLYVYLLSPSQRLGAPFRA
jgi:hypothetical protein